MKNDKKMIGKKRKYESGNESDEESKSQNPEESQNNSDSEQNENLVSNESKKENKNSAIKINTTGNNLITTENDKASTLFTFNKTTTFNNSEHKNEEFNKNENSNLNQNNNPINIINENNSKPKMNLMNTSSFNSKYKSINSAYSENSDDSVSKSSKHQRTAQIKTLSQKFKSHSQNSRNTAFGLKEISKRVMEIIKQSGQTTYKAISDQIVNEIKINEDNSKEKKDEKNIRRRIYDSLNVMKSMKLFHRDKNSKTIMWNYEQEFDPLNEIENKNEGKDNNNDFKVESGNIVELKKTIKEKKEKCKLLSQELTGLKNVLERNNRENENIKESDKLYFPFIVIEFKSNKDPKINIALNENQTNAHLGFDEADTMYGDLDMVSKIGNHPNFNRVE